MSWRYGRSAVDHLLPIGVSERLSMGDRVSAGDTLASGAVITVARRILGARHLGVAPSDLAVVTRVSVGQELARGAVLARTGRRLTRAVVAPFEGRLVHISAEGDFYLAPLITRWVVRSVMTGEVTHASDSQVTVAGEAWALAGIAAWGPDAVGELALGVDGPEQALAPQRLDVRLRDRILVGGARIAAEALTRAHACGVAGVVAGAVPAGGLRVVYGDDVAAAGGATTEDRPTVLCLVGFGTGPLPSSIYEPLATLAGSLAAIHVASARLFVFAPADAGDFSREAPALALAPDFASVSPALSGTGPAANTLPFDALR